MRKITIEFILKGEDMENLKWMLKDIHSYSILDSLKIDWDKAMCVDLIEVILKEGMSIDELEAIGHMKILNVLKSEGDKHICLAKHIEPETTKDNFQMFDLDLIPATPTIVSEEKCTASFIGENENLKKFLEIMKLDVEIINISFKKAVYEKHDLLSVLTDKQRHILITAHNNGYYDYPKKIHSKELSEKVNLSKATLVQHLRKAEGRILGEIIVGST